mmetsp:Transcript_11415/g.19434  ORF Transcript_11415/g.19434 Transcript_11415/m.19434 type:complete len:109 (-) Transcript_11415:134-460(-)
MQSLNRNNKCITKAKFNSNVSNFFTSCSLHLSFVQIRWAVSTLLLVSNSGFTNEIIVQLGLSINISPIGSTSLEVQGTFVVNLMKQISEGVEVMSDASSVQLHSSLTH